MARNARAYKSEKRRKEIKRQKKRDEKRQRRVNKNADGEPDAIMVEGAEENMAGEQVDTPEATGQGEGLDTGEQTDTPEAISQGESPELI